jgi:hypothetical protein
MIPDIMLAASMWGFAFALAPMIVQHFRTKTPPNRASSVLTFALILNTSVALFMLSQFISAVSTLATAAAWGLMVAMSVVYKPSNTPGA